MISGSRLAARFASLRIREPGSFWRLTGVLFLVYLSTGLWSPLFSVYIKSMGAGTRDIGLVLATFQAASLLSQYWWGRRSDRLGRRKPLLLWGTAGLGVAYLAIATVPQWTWLFPVRLLEGVALAAYSTGSLALIGDLLEDQSGRGRLMGIYRTFGSLAFAMAALGGGWLADHLTIRLPFLLAATCYGLAFVLAVQIKERPAEPLHPAAAQPQSLASNSISGLAGGPAGSNLWPFLFMTFMWMFAMGGVVSLWPVYMQSVGYSKTAVGSLWALAAAGEVPCLILAGHLADLWGRKRVLLTGVLCMACVFLWYTVSTALIWLVAVQLFRSFAYACFEAPALLLATELGLRRQRGRLASFYYSASGVGGIAGPVVGGAIAQEIGLAPMYRGVAALMIIGVVVAGRGLPGIRSAGNTKPGEAVPRAAE
ncbi:MAG: MFS transporter [Chloroflexota bacterium]|nr:MFS transporter [Chloroflexota bacterium]